MTPPKIVVVKRVDTLLLHHSVKSNVLLKNESMNGVSSARLSSRNGSPNSVLLKNFFLETNGLHFRML